MEDPMQTYRESVDAALRRSYKPGKLSDAEQIQNDLEATVLVLANSGDLRRLEQVVSRIALLREAARVAADARTVILLTVTDPDERNRNLSGYNGWLRAIADRYAQLDMALHGLIPDLEPEPEQET